MEQDQVYTSNKMNGSQPTFNAKGFLLKYLHYSWLFGLVMILTLITAWLYLRYTKPLYSVSSTLLIRNDNMTRGGGMGGEDMFSDIALFQSNSNKQNEILILSSRSMMERMVLSLGLQTRYSVVGNVKTTDIYPEQPFMMQIISLGDTSKSLAFEIHFSIDWKSFRLGEDNKDWVTGQEVSFQGAKFKILPREAMHSRLSFRDFKVQWMPLHDAAIFYLKALIVKPANDQSNVLSLSYIHENPILASAILNELMRQYNDAAIEDKNEINRKILAFINDRLSIVENQLDSVEGKLQEFRTSHQVIDLTAQTQMYFGNATLLNENMRQQEVQLNVIELLEQYINQPSNRMSLVPSTLGITDPTLLELTAGYNVLVSQRTVELQTGATANNPVVKNLEKNIEQARLKIVQNLFNIKQAYRNTINTLKSQSGVVKKEISTVPEKERQSRERARQQEIKQNLYLYLMQKREEAEIAQASTISSSRIIDTSLPLLEQVNPIPLKVYGVALLAGLLVPIIIIYVLDLLNDKVTTREDIIKLTNTPLLGEVGHSAEEVVLLFPERSRTIVAEQMRILRSNLRFILRDKFEKPTILVTSSFSGEGKSFISTNLGATLAISGKRTIILEFDLRKPKILAGLGLPTSHQGLTNYLVGSTTSFEDLAQPVPQIEGLFVISCGPVPPNPSEILLTPRVNDLFKWLKQNFDAIVIDSAPIGLVSDSFTLSQYVDSTIYVVRQRYTYKHQIGFIDELYQNNKLPNMGLLVNDVVTEGVKGYYGYGSRYGYGYGYGMSNSYYDDVKKGFFRKRKRKKRESK